MIRLSTGDISPGRRVQGFIALAAAVSLLLTACVSIPASSEPAATLVPTQSQNVATPVPPEAAARAALASELGVAPDQIEIVSAERVEWPDACLGAPAEGEMCAQMVTPGYRVVLEAGGQKYEVHTDESGRSVRVVTP